jgi:hypothetical protein
VHRGPYRTRVHCHVSGSRVRKITSGPHGCFFFAKRTPRLLKVSYPSEPLRRHVEALPDVGALPPTARGSTMHFAEALPSSDMCTRRLVRGDHAEEAARAQVVDVEAHWPPS